MKAIVIGGGFYGSTIATYLKFKRGFEQVWLVESEPGLLLRASYGNQARVHNGYHYPRSLTTAFRSRINLPRFVQDYPSAIKNDFTNLYAIARQNSKVTAKQFERFCFEIGAKLDSPIKELRNLFDARLIENIYQVEEYVFDATVLATLVSKQLLVNGVHLLFNAKVKKMRQVGRELKIEIQDKVKNESTSLRAPYVFNCTYSGINQLGGDFPKTTTLMKHELAEMALIETPKALCELGITVMDGPFFSLMPFPAKNNLQTLSHVRYTPHSQWLDLPSEDPQLKLSPNELQSRYERMIRDAAKYVPLLRQSLYRESIFQIKTVLEKNEADDGRPILFEKHADMPGCYSILGGKIDNIYDVLEKLDQEIFS